MTGLSHAERFDVAIVGAGPAGCAAAFRLASAGAAVALLEKEALPRYKTCGGGLVQRARRLLPVDVSAAVERECHIGEINALRSGIRLIVERDGPLVSMTMRGSLDFLLAKAARRAGADLRTRCLVRDLEQRPDRVELDTSLGAIVARFVVAADGALSRVARAAGWEGGRHLVPALECEIAVSDRDFDRLSRTARFDIDVLAHGYGWVFPKREHLSVGVASFGHDSRGLPATFMDYRKRIGLDRIESERRHGYVIPIGPRKGGFVKGRVILAGDAAGFADPVTAEGISFAVLSGQIAAEVLLDADFASPEAGVLYQRRVKERILSELRLGRLAAKLLFLPQHVRSRLMRRYGQRLADKLADVFSGGCGYREFLGAGLIGRGFGYPGGR